MVVLLEFIQIIHQPICLKTLIHSEKKKSVHFYERVFESFTQTIQSIDSIMTQTPLIYVAWR